jgi:hypothetical protein
MKRLERRSLKGSARRARRGPFLMEARPGGCTTRVGLGVGLILLATDFRPDKLRFQSCIPLHPFGRPLRPQSIH